VDRIAASMTTAHLPSVSALLVIRRRSHIDIERQQRIGMNFRFMCFYLQNTRDESHYKTKVEHEISKETASIKFRVGLEDRIENPKAHGDENFDAT
jgi:hypothetical protein